MSDLAQTPLTQGQEYTLSNEGKRYQTYDDATGESIAANGRAVHTGKELTGTLTIGVGHTGNDFKPGDIWTEFQVMTVFRLDYHKALEAAYELVRNTTWNAIQEARQAVLVDMAFELGGAGLGEFRMMLGSLRAPDYERAALEITKSKYATQAPIRAARNVAMMKTGEWQMPRGMVL